MLSGSTGRARIDHDHPDLHRLPRDANRLVGRLDTPARFAWNADRRPDFQAGYPVADR